MCQIIHEGVLETDPHHSLKSVAQIHYIERNYAMKKGEIIKLSDGQKATIVTGDESTSLHNCYIVRLENEDIRVVDRKTLTLAEALK